MKTRLTGWNHLVYTLIKSHFKNYVFSLQDLYHFEEHFKEAYPTNLHIKDKLRQILQQLRDKGLLIFLTKGTYQLTFAEEIVEAPTEFKQELVYLLSNESIPGWVKIGRTNAIDRRLKELYNTSVPLPFQVEETIETISEAKSRELEKSIHSVIDTLNPALRKDTAAKNREFFKMSVEDGKKIFKHVYEIVNIVPHTRVELTR